MFRRRRREQPDETGEATEPSADDTTEPADGEVGSEETAPPPGTAPERPTGPWDLDDAPDDETARLDLGGLRVPVLDGMEVRVEVDNTTQQVVAATLVEGNSAMQVSAFAAPKTEGLWAEVRAEIVASLQASGGGAEVTDGPFGPEIRARVPAEVPGQGAVLQPARFVGVDGPRWFLRGLLSGPAATDPAQAGRLEGAFRAVVVVRGGDPMAPRDPLPLQLPREATEAAAAQQAEAEEAQAQQGRTTAEDLNPFERGPEITETR